MQTRIYDIRLKEQTEEWMTAFDSYITHACTFTFQQEVNGNKITATQAWNYWTNYCKYLNRNIYKHAAKNNGKSLVILPILHGEIDNSRLHIHAAIGCIDRDYSFEKLKAIINSTWRDMKWTLNETEIVPYRNSGWINYMLHESVRLDLCSVDITRCFLPKRLQAEILS